MNTPANGSVFVLYLPEYRDHLPLKQLAYTLASPEKQNKLNSYTCKAEYERSLFADLLTRSVLSRMTGIAPGALKIMTGAFGKPELCSAPQHGFNVSHSGDYAVCAVSRNACGVDVEAVHVVRHGFAARFFHPYETAFLETRLPEQYYEYLCRIWTLKEAYVKYLGCGLHKDISAFSFVDAEHHFITHTFAPELSFQQFTLPGGYILSVCGEEPFQQPFFVHPEWFRAG